MEYRKLGRWGIRVSSVGLGSYLTIGHHLSDNVSRQIVEEAYDSGVNFFDTANVYNYGQAEKALGRILSAYPRDSYVLASKVWAAMSEGPNDRGLSRKHVFEQCHASLIRLDTDYLDLYQCHRFDPATPLEETIRTLDDLIRQGKILYWGVSEWTTDEMLRACEICERWGLQPPVSNQPRYSLLWRYPETAVFPVGQAKGMGQVVFSPLAHGVLTGKYRPGEPPPQGTRAADGSQNRIMLNLYYKDEILKRVQELAALAGELDITTAQLATAWILHNPAVSSVISGVTRLEQLQDNLQAAGVTLSDEMVARVTALFPVPETSPEAP